MSDFEYDPEISVNPRMLEDKTVIPIPPDALSTDELYDVCDKHFGDWIAADQEGEIIIYTGLKFKGDNVVKRYPQRSKIYGGPNNNNHLRTATYKTKTPKEINSDEC